MPIRPVNLTGKPAAQPIDLQTRQAQEALAQEMALQLIGSAIQPAIPAFSTGKYMVPNYGEAIAKVANAYLGNKRLRESEARQQSVADENVRRLDTGMRQYMMDRFGTERQIPNDPFAVDAGEPATVNVGQKGNLVKAIAGLLSSQHPQLMAMGAEELKNMPNPKEMLQYGDKFAPEALAAFSQSPGNPELLKSRPTTSVEGGIATTKDETGVIKTQPVQKFGAPYQESPGGPTLQKEDVTGKVSQVSGQFGNVTPQADLAKHLGAASVKQLEEGRKGYTENIGKLGSIVQIKEDMANIPEDKFGALATFRNYVNKLAELAGAEKLPDTAGIEQVHSSLGRLLLKDVRALAPVTQTDVSMIQTIVGSEGMTKRSLAKVMDILENATHRDMKTYTEMVKSFPVPRELGWSEAQFREHWIPSFSTAPVPGNKNPYAGMTDEELMGVIRGKR